MAALQFHELGLDDRLLKSIADLGWAKPTLIQEKAIPLALEGKDLLARARTGSGKTAAYSIPIIQNLLQAKMTVSEQAIRVLILVPTKELGQQVQQMIRQLTVYCARDIKVADISGQADISAQRPILMEKPDIVVGTPSRVLTHMTQQTICVRDTLQALVIDEADLVFSFGFEEDLKNLLCQLPKIFQSFLMSATFSEDVQALKELVLHNPVTLKLEESQFPDSSQLTQFHIQCEEEDKFLLLYTLLKLSLIRGKTIIFVNEVDRSYRLKLFLEQFSIPACVLNSELPIHSRCHIISQFNQGFYDYIIATDEHSLADPSVKGRRGEGKKKGGKGQKGQDKEYGVSRGIDFQNVSTVLNFDFPQSVDSYIHRAGRTARANNPGVALTFVAHTELPLLSEVEEALGGGVPDEHVLKPYRFCMEEVEGFRYRCRDAMRSVTKQAIKEARLKEIKEELLNSEKLKTYFEDNPRDFQLLRHDKPLHPAIVKPHLKNVPEYLIPPALRAVADIHNRKRKRRKLKAGNLGFQGTRSKFQRGQNPLRSFKYAKSKRRRKPE
ncbi:probable ATP-dependent RNA helicase DDX56 [Xenopus tropicalis]|uniref:Probable ATP-dependent RNA helicase DDX56 n=1 Tax=Xenopus tropicalis TaxID=8364 RepID=B1WAT1_XENTR|nr:probable ATP-dependent RNA helicase DDX56 [Xenopus tropicalis]AAI61488.1 LOC100145707 protein [Xenopus tropicalis]|eukprot:NP_001120553.1 probable ATP-dependent RNA helicase DDX56 [Xenopus tropicalis]